MPARVLFVSHTAELNGAERMLLDLLRSLDRRVFRPLLVVPRSGPLRKEAEALNIPSVVVPMKWWLSAPGTAWRQPPAWLWNIRSVFRLRRLIRRRGIDLVCSNSAAAVGGALAARLAGRPHVWIIHEILSGPRPLLRFFLGNRLFVRVIRRLSRRVVVNSLATGAAFRPAPGVDVVHNGILIPRTKPAPDPALRKKLGLRVPDRVVGVVGRLAPAKGQAEMVEALALVRGRVKGLKVLFVGPAAGGRFLGRLRETAVRRDVEGDVRFAGSFADVFSVLPLMSLLVSASRVESFGRTIVEAQAAGIPVLAVATGGVPEIIRHGVNGFLVESNRPEALAGALVDFFSRKKAEVARVVGNARKSVAREFRAETQARKMEGIFRSVLEESRRGR
ncbi:MAG: glycosyltransferase family 4 protein [Candidatus Aminicenantes bacterium]|nr:glycosyltransferase family 4 protein [Candidatus Aminicenantes bacterium]